MQKIIAQFIVKNMLSEEGRKRLLIIVGSFVILLFLPIIIIISINPFSAFAENTTTNDPYINAQKDILNQKKVTIDVNILRAIDMVLFQNSDTDPTAIEARANKYLYYSKQVQIKELHYLHDYINFRGNNASGATDVSSIDMVQTELLSLGYTISYPNGIYDDKTKEALIRYQKSNGIKQTGLIDKATWDGLFNNTMGKNIVIKNGKCYKEVTKTITVYVANSLDEAINSVKKDKKITSTDINNIYELYQYALIDQEGSDYSTNGSNSPAPITKSTQQFIDVVKDSAIKTYKEYGVLPSITIAQGILESGSGSSSLSRKYNNLFGIKADSSWKGQSVQLPTQENYSGVNVTIMAAFRVYSSWGDSIEDHGKFLKNNSTYTEHGVFTAQDYAGQANALQSAGYATDPTYASQLIDLIKEYNLNQYDIEARA